MGELSRIVYRVFTTLLFVVSGPLQGFICICIVLTSGFPVFFRQKRTGQYGKPFTLVKFRTMVAGADRLQIKYKKFNEANGPVFKIRNDPRFTQFGKLLSHTGLDELPQLWNVAKGDMALFGPRPLPISEAKELKDWQKKRHVIKPGILSSWILEGYHRTSFDDWMKSDIAYAKKKSLFYDLKLLSASLVFMLRLFIKEVKVAVFSDI